MTRPLLLASALAALCAPLAFAPGVLAQGVPAEVLANEIQEPDAVDADAPPPAPAADPFAVPADDTEVESLDEFRETIPGQRVVLRGLNKVTAGTEDFAIGFDEPLQFGSLTVLARYCSRRPPELIPETFVFLEIFDRTFDGAETTEYGQKIFSGWMLGSSPALHGLEHPVYDIWPVACQAPGDAEAVAQAAAETAAAAEAIEEAPEPAADEVFLD